MMMIKFATFFVLALTGAAANQSGEGGLRGLKSTNEDKIASFREAVEVLENENERDLSGWCYDYYPGAIRTSSHPDSKGTEGTHYHLYEHQSESWCKSSCDSYSWCQAYEYYHYESRCELWKGWYGYYYQQDGFKSYVKKHC